MAHLGTLIFALAYKRSQERNKGKKSKRKKSARRKNRW